VLTDENGDPDPEPVLQVAGERHEEALTQGGQRGDPHRVRVVLLSLHIHFISVFRTFSDRESVIIVKFQASTKWHTVSEKSPLKC
jgi:hypothetical protein